MTNYYCWWCGCQSDLRSVYDRHQIIPRITIKFKNGLTVTLERADDDAGGYFECPWEYCSHRGCDTIKMRHHVENCSERPEDCDIPKAVLIL